MSSLQLAEFRAFIWDEKLDNENITVTWEKHLGEGVEPGYEVALVTSKNGSALAESKVLLRTHDEDKAIRFALRHYRKLRKEYDKRHDEWHKKLKAFHPEAGQDGTQPNQPE